MKENTGAINAQVPVDVATFLLNEKRVDLQLIETRHRVTVMLIPNVHLETPNYTVTRMRHDDLNKTEPLAPSYHLVEAPAEEEQKTQSKASEAPPPRPEAAVRGITPQQAPIPVAREARPEQRPAQAAAASSDVSIIGKIFGLFRRKPEVSKPASDTPQATPDRDRGRGRGGRPERDGGRRDRQQERPQQGGQRHRQDQDRQRDGGRHRHDQQRQDRQGGERRPDSRRDQNQGQQNQGQRPQQQPQQSPRPPMQADAARPPQDPQQPHQPREHGEQREGQGRGRRRRRGGRDRHERQGGEGGGQQSNRPQQGPREHHRPVEAFPVASLAEAERAHHAAATAVAEPVEHVSTPVYEAPAAPAPAYERETVREFEPNEPAAPRPAPVSGAGYAPAVPVKIEWPADLQQVESDPGKVSAVQQEPVQEHHAPRPKRVRQTIPQAVDEPLVQIETERAESPSGGSGEKTPA